MVLPDDIGPLLNPASAHALDQAAGAVAHDDPRRFYGYMALCLTYELAAVRRQLRADNYQLGQLVGILNYIATKPQRPDANFPP